MPLPRSFEIVVQRPRAPGRREHTGAAVSTGDIQTLEAQVSALMAATNAAVTGCSAMQATDVTAWQGVYSAWQTWDKQLQGCISGMPGSDAHPPDIQCMMAFGFNWDSTQTQLNSYAAQAASYQQRVKAACPDFVPTPTPSGGGGVGPTPPGHQCTWLESLMGNCNQGGGPSGQPCGWFDSMLGRCQQQDTTSWPTAIKWVAILGVLGITAWYLGPFIAAIAGGATSAVRRRAGEFGNMDMELGKLPPPTDRPKIESFEFGDVAASDVLTLLKVKG